MPNFDLSSAFDLPSWVANATRRWNFNISQPYCHYLLSETGALYQMTVTPDLATVEGPVAFRTPKGLAAYNKAGDLALDVQTTAGCGRYVTALQVGDVPVHYSPEALGPDGHYRSLDQLREAHAVDRDLERRKEGLRAVIGRLQTKLEEMENA